MIHYLYNKLNKILFPLKMLTNQQTKLVIELIQSVITCEKSLEIIR